MKVTSTKMCFFHGRRFRPGTPFDLPTGVKPSADMTVVDWKKPAKGSKNDEGPSTFSELAKIEHKAQGDNALV